MRKTDNDRTQSSVPFIINQDELEIPPGIDNLFDYYDEDNLEQSTE